MRKLNVIASDSKANCKTCIGSCCGYYFGVPLTDDDIHSLAIHFKLEYREFTKKYTRPWFEHILIKNDKDGVCMFFDNGCSIYNVRPNVCQKYKMNGSDCRKVYVDKSGQTPTTNKSINNVYQNTTGRLEPLRKLLDRV